MFGKKKQTKKIVLIQGSLNPQSNTALLIDEAARVLAHRHIPYEVFDLRRADMDFCDGRPIEKYNQDTKALYETIKSADAYIFGMPVYSYSISGALKNLIDITSGAMQKKVAGILCNSAGRRSYLASVDLMKILSYEADMVTVQPIVHTDRETFKDGKIFDDHVIELIAEMIDGIVKYLR
ncbi:NAD(P)H-dependent oxidoreductase [Candidatus Uhrbacteria bacterium]|nr:NAD(P)H-dependent oxidoreductase [Candidatus Uhrbacteria bacterium]